MLQHGSFTVGSTQSCHEFVLKQSQVLGHIRYKTDFDFDMKFTRSYLS